MRKKNCLSLLTCIICLTACVNRISEDDITIPDDTKAELNIRARTGVEDLSPTLPIHIYAFDRDLSCVAAQSLSTAEEEISLELPEGSYTVYALTGAGTTVYSLPATSGATPTTAINLVNGGSTHQELEAGNAAITLTDGATTDLMLTVTRIVAQVNATITGLSEDITAVTVSLEPLHSVFRLDGTYGDDTSARATFSLEKGTGGAWSTAAPVFILPGEGNATVTIALTNASGTRNYAYNSNIQIEANYKIEISANYTVSTGPDINGSIKSTDWAGNRSITFDFGPDGTSDSGNKEDNIPSVGGLYKGCYVLEVTDLTASSANLLLVTPHQWEDLTTEDAERVIASYSVDGISDWVLPNRQQAEKLFFAKTDIPDMRTDGVYYLFDDGTMRCFESKGSIFNSGPAYDKTGYSARGVKVVSVSLVE